MTATIQQRLDLQAIQDGVARFGRGPHADYCAVLELGGTTQSLARLDDARQEELLAGYAHFLNAVTFPFQVLVQVQPVDLSWYAARVDERARDLPPGLVALARDQANFVLNLGRQRTLLARRTFVVVPWHTVNDEPVLRGWLVLRTFRSSRPAQRARDQELRQETIIRQLGDRCDTLAQQLGRAGLRATRLDDAALAQLYQTCWAPTSARSQRLRRELTDYTALVVGRHRPPVTGSPRTHGEKHPWP